MVGGRRAGIGDETDCRRLGAVGSMGLNAVQQVVPI
jgi:hypothetical protein